MRLTRWNLIAPTNVIGTSPEPRATGLASDGLAGRIDWHHVVAMSSELVEYCRRDILGLSGVPINAIRVPHENLSSAAI